MSKEKQYKNVLNTTIEPTAVCNTTPPYNGKKARVHIQNMRENNYLVDVKILLNDDEDNKEVLYQSPKLKPGECIEKAKLRKKLSKGKHKATAIFTSYDLETKKKISKRQTQITIQVKRKIIPLLIIILAIFSLCVASYFAFKYLTTPTNSFFDKDAQDGWLKNKSQEEIIASLNEIVEKGMLNISIASTVLCDTNGNAQLNIENIPANHYFVKVRITLDDTGEVVYESGGIKPGQYIETASLSKKLGQGSYDATASFTSYDQESLEKIGQAAARIRLLVQ